MNKITLRENNKNLRKTLDKISASNCITGKILEFEPFLRAKNVLIYHPLKYEIDLLELVKAKNKNFYLPKVYKNELIICPYSCKLQKSAFGVMEPCEGVLEDISLIAIAFIPCLAIDKNLNRLGYGKGYYDRLFSNKNFKALKVAVINKELLVEDIQPEAYDKKVDFVITD